MQRLVPTRLIPVIAAVLSLSVFAELDSAFAEAADPRCTVEYFEDAMEGSLAKSVWSHRTVSSMFGRRFLGPFGNEPLTLTLGDLPTQSKLLEVSFDLMVLGPWSGSEATPDTWSLSVQGGGLIRQITFPNPERKIESGVGYDIYRLRISFTPPPGRTITLIFQAANLSASESWGLDNVMVRVNSGAVPAIFTQPQSPASPVIEGSRAPPLTVISDAGALGYQWEFRPLDQNDWRAVPDATQSSLILTAARPSDAGFYRVNVTNCIGATLSEVVKLTVISVGASVPTPPTISAISDQTILEDNTTPDLLFRIGDDDTPPGRLKVSVASSNATLVPDENIFLGGSNGDRTLKVRPAANFSGEATITIRVTDDAGLSATNSFIVVVSPVNDQPTITPIPSQSITANGTSSLLEFGVGDVETNVELLTVSGSSSNPDLIPDVNVTLGGGGANRAIRFMAAADRFGSAVITLTVRDADGGAASSQFLVKVSAPKLPPAIALIQPKDDDVFSAPATLSIEAESTDVDGQVVRLELFQNEIKLAEENSNRLTFLWKDVGAGSYRLTARATDDSGLVSSSVPVNITVRMPANIPPTVSLTSPADGSSFLPDSPIVLQAAAADADGTVQRVEFYAGSTLLGASTVSPFAVIWESPPSGDHTLTARAIDNQGAQSASTPVLIGVSEAEDGEVAIVRNFAGPEIKKLQEYLLEMGFRARVFDRGELTDQRLARFRLIVWDDLGAEGLTGQEVELFNRAYQSGIPLYFIGEKLVEGAANLSASHHSVWNGLIRLSPSRETAVDSAIVSLNAAESSHPIVKGRFGVAADFHYPGRMEGTALADTSAQVLGQSGGSDVLVVFPHQDEGELGQTRVVTQAWLVTSGSDVGSLDERKKLFQNAVCWLLRCPSCAMVDLRLEITASAETVPVGGELVYELLASHSGECEATGVVVTDALPPQLQFVSAETDHGTWSEAGGVVTFRLGRVPNGSVMRMTLNVRPVSSGTITNEARLRSHAAEGSLENNWSAAVTIVEASARPFLNIRPLENGRMQLQISGEVNRNYSIQFSTDLVDWTPWTNFVSTSPIKQFVEPGTAPARQRFYRVTAW